MRTKFVSKLMTLVVTCAFVFACQNEDDVVPDQKVSEAKVTVEPLTDQNIIDEIQAMATGRSNSGERTAVLPPVTLPPGYNYNNMQTVSISGTSWVTYIAWSNTVNTVDSKEMVAIYYQGGVYKNFIIGKWFTVDHPAGMKYYHRFKVPEDHCASKPYNWSTTIIPATNQRIGTVKVYPPSACGATVVDCVRSFYEDHGWLSLGLQVATFVRPEIFAGAIGGCMVYCMLNGPVGGYVSC